MLSLLRMRLHQAIVYWSASTGAIAVSAETTGGLEQTNSALATLTIPLKQTGKAPSLRYTSPIAYRLATQPQQATTIAAQVVNTLLQVSDDLEALPKGITVQAVAGFIHFELGDRAIAAWLDQRLVNTPFPQTFLPAPMTERERQVIRQSAAIFEAQYAYARCCSLLRLAHRETLIRLEKLEEAPRYWQFDSTTSPHWFTADHFVLNHHADRGLLLRLFEAFDCVSDPSPQRTPIAMARSAQAVSQAFQVFHRLHPLWRQTEKESAIVIARLGLLMATQRILYWLLAEGLHLTPALEL
jgi:DALR anticodon binding domain